ncbi:alpha/beta fold hydrolase [Amorphoplanes digitatis]|uniref:Pimeloyl-ACP methyl ester carboxylesterase n=1 Tax=Actinoplanes digitatis TaxID=1868 RepID=A0A7W7MPV0_9ACTN|nr:alpha/beta fold hydrolase [Actinoplanes digitatis]MBB4762097.1 pimeloyl-ACP methyl ester carboxylesterase [Actinoplanes digitatis]GID97068.1 hydrolase [Actinoplanes digitatis]
MLAHERRGSGPVLVLIHGLGSRRQVWEPIVGALARHREVIALDLPGFGESPAWEPPRPGLAPGSVDHLADLVADFLAGLGVESPELAGNSLGGGIALELGRRGLARSVTAFAPVGFWGPAGRRWCQAVLGGSRALSTALSPALPRIVATRPGRAALCSIFYGRPGRVSAVDCLDSARALSAAPGFAAARRAFGVWRLPVGADPAGLSAIPVTIAWGTRDLVLPHRRQARRALEELPDARHVLLPGCGHLPFADDPERCADLLTVRQ